MKELEQVKKIIKQAGEEVMKYYGEGLDPDTHYKDENSPVTKADLASEKKILEGLQDYNYGILSEETSEENDRLNQEKTWVVDPLDGTKDFLQQTGEFTIMIGLVENGDSILGAVYQPAKNILYFATKDDGAFKQIDDQDPVQIFVSSEQQPQNMSMLVSRNHLRKPEQQAAEKLGIGTLQPCGSAGLKTSKVSEGRNEIYINSSDKTGEWDICAADIIISEAGGKITDIKGNKIKYNRKNTTNENGFVVSNGELHKEIIEKIN